MARRHPGCAKWSVQVLVDLVAISCIKNVPEQQEHAAAERLEVDDFRQRAGMFDVAEQRHADDGVNEGDQS